MNLSKTKNLIFKKVLTVVVTLSIVLSAVGGVIALALPDIHSLEIWDGTISNVAPKEGEGTAQKPYLISNGADLAWAVQSTGNYYFKLTKDIYLNDISKVNWSTGAVEDGYTVNSWIHGTWSAGNISF